MTIIHHLAMMPRFWVTRRKAAALINEDVLSIIHEFVACMAVKEALNKMNAGDMYPNDNNELLK